MIDESRRDPLVAALTEQSAHLVDLNKRLVHDNASLKKENKRLRKEVRYLHGLVYGGHGADMLSPAEQVWADE